jgi:hypothetical protein
VTVTLKAVVKKEAAEEETGAAEEAGAEP